jgi:ABC-type phosphate transport system substrate-binding protein
VAAAFAAGAPAASAAGTEKCGGIVGAGSSLQKIAQQEVWIEKGAESFGSPGERWKKPEFCIADPPIVYNSTSSGKGLALWGSVNKTLNEEELENSKKVKEKLVPSYVGTDVGPEGTETTGQIGNMDIAGENAAKELNGIVTVPVAQSAITVMVSTPLGCTVMAETGEHPRISNQALEEEWFARGVKMSELIEGVKFTGGTKCEVPPTLYARGAPSGTTCGFKNLFAHLKSGEPNEKTWKEKTETVEKCLKNGEWPAGTGQTETFEGKSIEKGSQLVEAVWGTPGSVGYADLADARVKFAAGTGITEQTKGTEHYSSFVVEVGNTAFGKKKAGTPPEEKTSGGSNCKKAGYAPAPSKLAVNQTWSNVRQTSQVAGGTENYPICTLTYDLAWHRYTFVSSGKHGGGEEAMNSVYSYLHYIVNLAAENGGQGTPLTAKHYGLLPEAPENIQNLAKKGLEKKPGEAEALITK